MNGRQDMSSEYDSKEVCLDGGDTVSMRVIKTEDQVLPYCVINIKQYAAQRSFPYGSMSHPLSNIMTNPVPSNPLPSNPLPYHPPNPTYQPQNSNNGK